MSNSVKEIDVWRRADATVLIAEGDQKIVTSL